jgi:hypothetical protein
MIGDTAPKRWRIAVDLLAVLTAVSLLVSGWAIYARFSETNATRKRNAAIWHAVICDIEHQIVVNSNINEHSLTLKRRKFILRFYDNLLVKDAHAQPCKLNPVTGR